MSRLGERKPTLLEGVDRRAQRDSARAAFNEARAKAKATLAATTKKPEPDSRRKPRRNAKKPKKPRQLELELATQLDLFPEAAPEA